MGDWHWVRKVTPEFDLHWRYLYYLTTEMSGIWMKTAEEYAAAIKSEVDVADIERAVAANDPSMVIDRLSWDAIDAAFVASATPALIAALERAGRAEMGRLKLSIRFDLQNPYVDAWVQNHAAELVTQVTAETKKAIRTVIADAFNVGFPPRKAAMAIRNLVGLTERDARAVLRYWGTVASDGNRSATTANAMADTYAAKLLRRRADTIARTEIVGSANAGVQSSWQQAQSQGFLLPTTMQEWIAAVGSPRTCQICLGLDGQRVSLGQPFQSSIGPVMGPTVHPACRCAVALYTEIPNS